MAFRHLLIASPHDYDSEELLNETNYSKIYKAYDNATERTVCIKTIDMRIFDGVDISAFSDIAKTPQEYIQNELKTMTMLSEETTHIPCLLDSMYDEANRTYYIVMQYCGGKPFRDAMDEVLAIPFLKYMLTLCDILKVMHGKNLYHKDIKPENLRLSVGDELMLLDFNTSLSAPNLYEGTPGYQAPEMYLDNFTARRDCVDVFAIGIMMYEYFGKVLPKINEDYYISGTAWGEFIKPSKQPNALPFAKYVDELIMKCLAFNPEERHTLASLKRALLAVTAGKK